MRSVSCSPPILCQPSPITRSTCATPNTNGFSTARRTGKAALIEAERLRELRIEQKTREAALGPIRKCALWTSRRWCAAAGSPPRRPHEFAEHPANHVPLCSMHRWFGQLSLTLIIVFSIMLAMYDPLDPDNETPGNKFISVTEKVFTVFFTIEVSPPPGRPPTHAAGNYAGQSLPFPFR